MSGFFLRNLSERSPEPNLTTEAVLSAIPSMRPIAAGPAPKTLDKNPGRSGWIISLDESFRKLVRPRR